MLRSRGVELSSINDAKLASVNDTNEDHNGDIIAEDQQVADDDDDSESQDSQSDSSEEDEVSQEADKFSCGDEEAASSDSKGSPRVENAKSEKVLKSCSLSDRQDDSCNEIATALDVVEIKADSDTADCLQSSNVLSDSARTNANPDKVEFPDTSIRLRYIGGEK